MKLSSAVRLDSPFMFRGFTEWLSTVWTPCLLALGVLLLLSSCTKEANTVQNREQMWEWVGHRLKVGMPLEAASGILEKEGFTCTPFLQTATKIVDINKVAKEGVFDFVKCEREDGSPPIKRHWEITLVHEGSLVKFIGLRFRDVYPPGAGSGAKEGS